MKDLYIGDLKGEDDGLNSKGGILGDGKDGASYSEDSFSRIILAAAIVIVIYLLYT